MRAAVLLAVLAALASIAGLLVPGLYRDRAFVAAGWLGNDLVTLAVIAPLLLGAAAMRSPRAAFVRLGLLGYLVYNYAFYAFGAAFNALFVLHVALVAIAGVALAAGIAHAPTADAPPGCRRLVAAWLALLATALAGVHGAMWLAFVTRGELPAIVVATGHPTHVVGALDLLLVATPASIAAWLLWRGRPAGVLAGVIVTVQSAAYMLALTVASLFAANAGAANAAGEVPLWVVLGVANAAAAVALLRHVPRATSTAPRASIG